MRWLMIALFVSVVGLLVAAAGVARHIWLHRRRRGELAAQGRIENRAAGSMIDGPLMDLAEETDLEVEP
jgi:hypothetical protein